MSINFEYIYNSIALEEAKKKLRKPNKSKSQKKRYSKYKGRLNGFWFYTPESPAARLEKLIEISNFCSRKATPRDLFTKRRSFNKNKYKLLQLSKCYVCKEKANHRHHLVQLQNGGTNIKNNLVGLCEECHAKVHPFMFEVQESIELEERMYMIIRNEK